MNILKLVTIAGTLLFCASTAFANDSSSGKGTVTETMDSAGYTYVRLQEDNRWVAGKLTKISIGDVIEYDQATEMRGFHSRTLNRTFEVISFAQILNVANLVRVDEHADSTAIATMGDELGITKSTAAVAPEAGEISPLEGGKTIVAIHAEYQQINDQEIALRARVMKVNKNILGKNWITLQDGTGTAPENKLLATSAELVEIGEIVTAKGVVKTNVDLGSGYTYKVVLEEATFTK